MSDITPDQMPADLAHTKISDKQIAVELQRLDHYYGRTATEEAYRSTLRALQSARAQLAEAQEQIAMLIGVSSKSSAEVERYRKAWLDAVAAVDTPEDK